MTASLLVFVPVALLVLVGTFCFVGCVLDTKGHLADTPAFTEYSGKDVIGNPSCVAFWPLNDSPGTPDKPQTLALDVVGKQNGNPHHGEYKSINRLEQAIKDLFPCPPVTLNAMRHSAGASGFQTIGATGILAGDTVEPHDPNNPIPQPCMQVDGGFVTVAPNSITNPSGSFTVEIWAQPEWSGADAPATYVVIDSRDATGANRTGFVIWVNETNNWEAQLGIAGMDTFLAIPAGKATLGFPNHVVLTYDGTNAAVFVDGKPSAQTAQAANFVPNTTFPLVIGVGGAFLADRTPGAIEPPPLFPIFPFNGKIQDVAIYNTVLSDTTISDHFEHGSGRPTET